MLTPADCMDGGPAHPVAVVETPSGMEVRSRRIDYSFIFVAVCLALFVSCVCLRLNGSSSAAWAAALNAPNETTGVIAGRPRATRSDEWLVWTPALLAQLQHDPPMPVHNPSLGAGASPLLMSLPVRHYSMFFRPQLWGFFTFDAEHGFAWFWNTKLFGLLIAFFFLFRTITGGRVLLAICAAVAVTYSSCVQWFFSSPTMLPEMMASWAVMLLMGRYLFGNGSAARKFCAATVLGSCTINFILCCYPPFQVPLVYLALALLGAFAWERRGRSLGTGSAWIAVTFVITAAVLWPTFLDLRSTLEAVAHTSYPGARRGTGGTMSVIQLFGGLLNFFDGSRVHPRMFPNTSEASNFFPIWVAAMAAAGWQCGQWGIARLRGEPATAPRPLVLVLAAFIVFFSFYAVVGLPEWLCRITALNFVTEKRALLAIALAGFLLTFVSLRRGAGTLVAGRTRVFVAVALLSASLTYCLAARQLDAEYLTPGYCAVYVVLTAGLAWLYFCAPPIAFAGALAAALFLNNFLVNPITEGLPILLRSAAAQHIAALRKADPHAAWAAYERGTSAQFLIASGARVLNGVKTVPDLELLSRIDPSDPARSVYNRYAFIGLALPWSPEAAPSFECSAGDFYRAFITPLHPAFRTAGLKYVVFPRLLSAEERGPMKLVDALPQNLLWIYELPTTADEPAIASAVAAN